MSVRADLHSGAIELHDLPPFHISRTANVRSVDEEVRRHACPLKQRKCVYVIRPKAIVEGDRHGRTRTAHFSGQQFVKRDHPQVESANHRELRSKLLWLDAISLLLFSNRAVTSTRNSVIEKDGNAGKKETAVSARFAV
jgi:hypothetical protein